MSLLSGLLLLASCGSSSDPDQKNVSAVFATRGEYIGRLHSEGLEIPPMEKKTLADYPWKKQPVGNHSPITKEYFRCKGRDIHPDKFTGQGGQMMLLSDCAGIEQHSLPLRNGQEFIYPILIKLLNFVQASTLQPVVITSGHRCPAHNRYNDPSLKSQYSKHMIGAEVSFYVKGMEKEPQKVIDCLLKYYENSPEYQGQKDYTEFKRWEKSGIDVSTLPWFNKEIFIKLYLPHEGRDFDNDHAFPYIAIQVRYDRELGKRVVYSWEEAFHNFWRW